MKPLILSQMTVLVRRPTPNGGHPVDVGYFLTCGSYGWWVTS